MAIVFWKIVTIFQFFSAYTFVVFFSLTLHIELLATNILVMTIVSHSTHLKSNWLVVKIQRGCSLCLYTILYISGTLGTLYNCVDEVYGCCVFAFVVGNEPPQDISDACVTADGFITADKA